VRVIRNDAFDPAELLAEGPEAIVISPGPGTPSRAGRIVELIRADESIPLLGICLGNQAIGEAFGGRIVRGGVPVHGKVTEVRHRGERLFENCPSPMRTARYHSLVVARDSVPAELEINAEAEDGAVMALTHKTRPIFGIQFHPESYGTTGGDQIIINFLARCHPERSEGSPTQRRDPSPSEPALSERSESNGRLGMTGNEAQQ